VGYVDSNYAGYKNTYKSMEESVFIVACQGHAEQEAE